MSLYQGKALQGQIVAPKPRDIVVTDRAGVTRIALVEARECPGCHTAHMFFVNRNGATLCVTCDAGDPS